MPAHVYNNWKALRSDPLNPRGAARTDWHFAHLAWSIWESQRARGEYQDVSDYLLRFVSPEQEAVVHERQVAMQEAELKARFEERKIKEYLRDKRR